MGKADIRDVSPLLKMWRNFLLGRNLTLALRFQDEVSTRSPPPPNLPDGPAHRLFTNYYYNRDVRREVNPPEVVSENQKLLKTSSAGEGEVAQVAPKGCRPGNVFKWD